MNMDVIHLLWWAEIWLRMAVACNWGWITFSDQKGSWVGGRAEGSCKYESGFCSLEAAKMSGDFSSGEGIKVLRSNQVWYLEKKPAHRLRKSIWRGGSPYCGNCLLCLEIWLLVNYSYVQFFLFLSVLQKNLQKCQLYVCFLQWICIPCLIF